MPVASIRAARSAIFTLFETDWDANTPAITPGAYIPELRFQGAEKKPMPAETQAWARIQVDHDTGAQTTLAGPTALKSFQHEGFVTVQVFAPRSGQGLTLLDDLVQSVLDIFQGKQTGADGVWFRNVTVTENGPDATWYQTNVTVDFLYVQLKS